MRVVRELSFHLGPLFCYVHCRHASFLLDELDGRCVVTSPSFERRYSCFTLPKHLVKMSAVFSCDATHSMRRSSSPSKISPTQKYDNSMCFVLWLILSLRLSNFIVVSLSSKVVVSGILRFGPAKSRKSLRYHNVARAVGLSCTSSASHVLNVICLCLLDCQSTAVSPYMITYPPVLLLVSGHPAKSASAYDVMLGFSSLGSAFEYTRSSEALPYRYSNPRFFVVFRCRNKCIACF